jgi:hypothetical protein
MPAARRLTPAATPMRSSPPSSSARSAVPTRCAASPRSFARWAAAFVVDSDGVARTKTLGIERTARRLRDALPGGDQPLRAAVWAFLWPMLSPRLTALNRAPS